jgi:hypothetical protein
MVAIVSRQELVELVWGSGTQTTDSDLCLRITARCFQKGRFSSRGDGDFRVDLDPVTANLGFGHVPLPVKYDEVGLLCWHVASNAVARDLMAALWEHAGLRLMTAQATLRECLSIVLLGVDIMASKTSHGRRLEAAASS